MSSRPQWAWGRHASDSGFTTQWTSLLGGGHVFELTSLCRTAHMVVLSRSALTEQALWTWGIIQEIHVHLILWLCLFSKTNIDMRRACKLHTESPGRCKKGTCDHPLENACSCILSFYLALQNTEKPKENHQPPQGHFPPRHREC